MSTTTTKRPMGQREYKQLGGSQCPYCRSTDIEGGFVSVDAGTATQKVNCNECEADWVDTYDLTGYAKTE